MERLALFLFIAALGLCGACENSTMKLVDADAAQNDSAAVTDDDTAQSDEVNNEANDGIGDEDLIFSDGILPDEDDLLPDGDGQPCVGYAADCGEGFYCLTALGDCSGAGICTPLWTDGCELLIDPVCGCNGKTYPSDCDAATHGMAMDHAGKCPTPATSSLTYDNTVEPWPGGANILEGSASFVSSPVDPAEVFTVPAPFETNKSFVTFVIYKQNNSPEHLLVTLSRTEMGGTLPATVTLQGPPDNTGLSRAERYYDTLLVGHLTGAVTITAFDEGGVPGAPVTLVLSGDALTFSWVDQ